jgi:ABC-type multidrug transport system ATPase subunit
MDALTHSLPVNEAAGPAEAGPMLRIRDLTHTYRNGVQALAGVSLDITRGMYGLLGPNGAGKSSLMRIVATLQQPTSGQVTFNGIDVVREPQRLRRVLGYLPQEFGVYKKVSAESLLDHLAVLKGIGPTAMRREQVAALLRQTNLYDVRKRAVATFSGGMRQRFGIAQALLGDPQLIIVDEPTAGLDPSERHRFHDLLAEIGESVVVILSTHILDDVARLCQRTAILMEGRVVAEGELATLVASLQGRLWRKAVARADVETYRKSFRVISSTSSNGHAILHVLNNEPPDTGFEPVHGDLQDVYFAMTAGGERAAA